MTKTQEILAALHEKLASPSLVVFTINAIEALNNREFRASLNLTEEDAAAVYEAIEELEQMLRERFTK